MKRLSTFVLPLIIAASLAACKRQAKETETAQEAPAAATAAAPAAEPAPAAAPAPTASSGPAVQAFDLQSVAVSSKTLPEFPYLALPANLKPDSASVDADLEFDKTYVLAGEDLRRVEGRVYQRRFDLDELKMSPLAAHRNYETALKAMGATRVDKIHPTDEALAKRHGGEHADVAKKMGIRYLNAPEDAEIPGFEQWLIRTPATNIWLSFIVDGGRVYLRTVEEKAMQQVVGTGS